MAEADRTRERERPPIAENPYEMNIRNHRARAERNRVGPIVIKPSDREQFVARQGRLMFYLNPFAYKDTPTQQWQVFKHEIRTKSGKHRHQGGVIIYVLDGKGYSIVDGERVDWKTGDLVLLPMKPEEVVHQHFNDRPEPSFWVAFYNLPIFEHYAGLIEQVEESPEFKG
jgi:quercetin dioxygenase-like cupin family protein